MSTVSGFALHVPDRFRPHYVDRPFEPLSIDFIETCAPAGGTAIDVGAHIGFVTLHIARAVGPDGQVFAFEPAKENLRYIHKNLRANRLENVSLITAAASDHDGTVEFNITGSSDSHGIYEHPNTATRKRIQVRAARVDSVVPTPIDFFKVDTEGAEIEVLDGMEDLLRKSPQAHGLVEWTPSCQRRAGRSETELIERLVGLGFEIQVLDDVNGIRHTVADALELLAGGKLPEDWYANLACRPSSMGTRP